VGVAVGLDILGIDLVASAVTHVVSLVVANHTFIGSARTLATCLGSDHVAATVALLAERPLVGTNAVHLCGTTPAARTATKVETTGDVTTFRQLTAHGRGIAVALAAFVTEAFTVTADALG
jgi:hypothetical protein